MRFKFSWTAVLTVLLAVVLLYLALRDVNWPEMLETVQQGRIEYLFLAFCTMTFSYFLRALRWRTLLTAEKPLHPLTAFWGTCIGYLGNYFLPARAGEFIRSGLIAQRTGINLLYVIATALTERIVDAALLVMIVIGLLPLLPAMPQAVLDARGIFLVIGFGGLIGLLIAPRLERLLLAFLARLPLSETIKIRLGELLGKFLLGVRAFQHPTRAAIFLSLTVLIWSIDVVVALFVAEAFGLAVTPPQLLFLLASLGLSSAIPSTPGYIGVYQFVAVNVLGPFGISDSQAVVYILAFQAMTYVLVILWGLLGLWRMNARLDPNAYPSRSSQSIAS
ncbi:MAG: flippase-like domain-containing protein [Anaerolineae bacterium]|jgi:hypothetical protein|nr:flippase-like domain-containing protein [Anaerolineae bacterium]